MKKIKAEMWDKMQFLFRNYYNRMMHAALYYDEPLDTEKLKIAVKTLIDGIPVLHSEFIKNPLRPYWKVRDYAVTDVLIISDEDDDEKREKFLCDTLPYDGNVQMKILYTPYKGGCSLIVIVNHMCMDGGDLKNFLKLLFKLYASDNPSEVFIKSGSRAYDSVYTKFDENDRKKAKKLYKNISSVKDSHYFPLTPDREDDITRIVRRKIDKDRVSAIIAYGKRHDATVNDVMLAAYIRALYDIGNYPETDSVTVPCMVDLRRHIVNNAAETGFCNHTGFMQCTVNGKGKDFEETLSAVRSAMNKNKEDKFLGLYSLPLLDVAYKYFPQFLSELLIKKFYSNPLLGMSNVGLLKAEDFGAGDNLPVDGFMTGAIKYKPYMQFAMTTLNGEMTLSVQLRCNDDDVKIIERFFDYFEKEINRTI